MNESVNESVNEATIKTTTKLNKSWFLLALSVVCPLAVCLSACGVRGKPLPPLTPPEIGRGKPTFRRATEDLAFPQVAPVEVVPDPEARGARSDAKP